MTLLTAATLLAGCGSASVHVGTQSSAEATGSSTTTLQSFPVTSPVPAGQPGKMVADPSGDAVWWWAVGEDRQARVYRFSATDHRLASWPLGDAEVDGLESGIQYGIAVGPSGVVWVGANLKLARLDTATGAVRVIDVPVMAPQQPSHPQGPPQTANLHPIAGAAVGDGGQVALATAGATAIPIYDPANNSFRQLVLPAGFGATDVAYLADGTLAVGLEPPTGPQENGAVLLVDPSGRTKLATGVEAGFVMPAGDRFLTGQVGLYWVYPDGATKPGPTAIAGQQWIAYASSHPAWPLADGHVAEVARGYDGLTDMANGQPARSITLPPRPCPTGAGGGSGGILPGPGPTASTMPTTTTTQVCHTRIGALAALGNAIWYLEDGQPLIWRVGGL
ncbi:MAG TPA: hypothetical protein VE990_06790 [Acidimicrobiales bacterium]|nr:hypothetical protein [Acidimicrobiales bacterium]